MTNLDTHTRPETAALRPHRTSHHPLRTVSTLLSILLLAALPAMVADASASSHTRARRAACPTSGARSHHHRHGCPTSTRAPRTHAKRHGVRHRPHRTVAAPTHATRPVHAAMTPASCEDASTPMIATDGSFLCRDGSEPSCEDGSNPIRPAGSQTLLCAAPSGSPLEISEEDCEEACTAASQPACEDACPATTSPEAGG